MKMMMRMALECSVCGRYLDADAASLTPGELKALLDKPCDPLVFDKVFGTEIAGRYLLCPHPDCRKKAFSPESKRWQRKVDKYLAKRAKEEGGGDRCAERCGEAVSQ